MLIKVKKGLKINFLVKRNYKLNSEMQKIKQNCVFWITLKAAIMNNSSSFAYTEYTV